MIMLPTDRRRHIHGTTIYEWFRGDLVRTAGVFGVELEHEGSRLPPEVNGWNVHNEGSLRGEAREYVTAGAYDRNGLALALDFLNTTFRAARAQPRESYRAGTHIHYNMQQRTIDSTIRSIILWVIVEPIFMKLCGAIRDGNLFCLSAYDTGDMHFWLQQFYQRAERDGRYNFSRGKYSSLNIDPLSRFGTLECRAFPTSWDKERILGWADLIDAVLKDHGMHPREMIDLATSKPEEFLGKIFGDVQLPEDRISLVGFGIEQAFLLVEIYCENMGET